MKTLFSVLSALVIIFVSCENKDESEKNKLFNIAKPVSDFKAEENQTGFIGDSAAYQDNKFQNPKKQSQKSEPTPDWDKKIIKTASLDFEIKDFNGYYATLKEKIKNLGGYVAQEQQNQTEYKIENTLVIKVPADQFDNAVASLTSNIEKLNTKNISSQDVTGEYVDTRSRMEAKKQVRLRYLDLLKQAKNMEEILNVQSEINGIQEEIEAANGRINYLGHSSAFSTINLTYYQILNATAKNDDNPSFGTKLTGAFKTGWESVVEIFVGLVYIWPLILVTAIIICLFRRIKLQKTKPVV